MRKEYVHQSLSQCEIEEIISDPELMHAAHEQLEQAFEFDEMRPELPAR